MDGSERTGAGAGETRFKDMLTSPYLAIALAMFFWAGSTVVVRGVHETVPPVGLSFWRTLLGAVIILPFAWRPLMANWHLVRGHVGALVLLSFLLFVGGNAVLFVSLQYTIAINAGVLNSFEPVLILIAAWAIFHDEVTIWQVIGVAISLLGVLALIGRGSIQTLAALDFNFGDILVLGAYTSWAFYAVYLRKAPRGLDPKATLLLVLTIGSGLLLPFYIAESVFVRPVAINVAALASISVLALFSSVFSILLWNYGVVRLGPGRASIFIHLIVVYTVILAIVFLGEIFQWFHGVGIALIMTGIYLSTIRRRAQA